MKQKKTPIPLMFKPLLWDIDWKKVDAREDKDDLILNALNLGTMKHINWIAQTYGAREIRHVLSRRLQTELYPESRNLARVLFDANQFSNARKSSHIHRAKARAKTRSV